MPIIPPTPWQGNTSSVSSSVDLRSSSGPPGYRRRSATNSDHDRLADRHVAGRRRDRDQADHRPDARAERRRLRPLHPVEEDPREHRGSRRRVRRRKRQRRLSGSRHRRPGVESEPAEPKHAGSQNHKRHVGRVVALPRHVTMTATQNHRARPAPQSPPTCAPPSRPQNRAHPACAESRRDATSSAPAARK